jgi:hypothetical protein
VRRGWHFLDKPISHQRYEPVLAFVIPRGLHMYVAEADAVHDMFMRRLDSKRPNDYYSKFRLLASGWSLAVIGLLEVYGP